MIGHIVATMKHRFWVQVYLWGVALRLVWRGLVHDLSKYHPAEARRFAKALPGLKASTYGSDEYNRILQDVLSPALEHHYANNSHHPEHHDAGIRGMDLYDLVEMWCDWRAATRRHAGGDIYESIKTNARRFDLDPDLVFILGRTAPGTEPTIGKEHD